MVDRAVALALVVAVLLAGCPQGIDNEEPQLPGERQPDTETPTVESAPQQSPTPERFTWHISRVAGLDLQSGSVGRLAVVLSRPGTGESLAIRDGSVLVQHAGESYRFVHEQAEGDADGTFTVGAPGPEPVLLADDDRQTRVVVVDIGPDTDVPVPLGRSDTARVLVSTPTLTTETVDLAVPEELATDVNVQLAGEFAWLEREPERERAGRPAVVAATASEITPSGAGMVNITVTKLPGTAPIDYRNVTVKYAGVGGFRTLTYPDGEADTDADVFRLSPVRDADGSAPVLNDDDRFRLSLALGTDTDEADDGSTRARVGERLPPGEIALVELTLDTRRTRFLRLRLPHNVTEEPVPLDGVVPKSESFPTTRERPTMGIVTSDAQRVANGTALGGIEVDLFKPPTAAPIDPRTLTLDVRTPNGSYTLVHPSANATADGHFGLESRFDLDYSAPVLDDDFDFARLEIDLGADTYDSDDGPLGTSVGDNLSAGSLVTVTATTENGVSASRAYLVTDRD